MSKLKITLDTSLFGKKVKVYRKPFKKEEYEGNAVIVKELNEVQFGNKIYNCCNVVFGLEEKPVVRTISKEDILQ